MSKRDTRYEFIRCMSMVLVVGVHALAAVPGASAGEILGSHVFSTLFFLCNGLFFMLSGKFALGGRFENPGDYGRYYGKRLGSIGIPVLVFMLLRTMHNGGWFPAYLISPELWQDFARNVLGGFRSCEYWFLYPLAGLLAAAPFLGKILQNATRAELLLLLAMGLGYNALCTYLPGFGWDYPLGGWLVIFLLGYALEKLVTTPRQEWAVIALGGACFVLTVVQKHLGNAPGANDLAPAYAGMVSGAFLALKKLYRPGKIADAIVTTLGKHSLAVYMLHMLLLPSVLEKIPFDSFWLRLPALILMTTLVTLIPAFVLDKTLIAPLQWLWRKVFRL